MPCEAPVTTTTLPGVGGHQNSFARQVSWPAEHGQEHLRVLDPLRRDREEVLREDDEVGELAGRERALLLLARAPRRPRRG